MVGGGLGAKNGILFKTAASLEETGRIEIVALDKTGTITSGEPKVTDILPAEGVSAEELLRLANTLERKSEHPLAKAILEYAKEQNVSAEEVADFQALPGNCLLYTSRSPMRQQRLTFARSAKSPVKNTRRSSTRTPSQPSRFSSSPTRPSSPNRHGTQNSKSFIFQTSLSSPPARHITFYYKENPKK